MCPTTPAVVRNRAEALADLTDISQELQQISRGIHPAVLSKGGLAMALRMLAGRSAVPTTTDVAIDRCLPDSVEIAAYYIVSEALTNVAKHSHATAVTVSAYTNGAKLHLSVQDNGIGGANARKAPASAASTTASTPSEEI